MATTKPVSVLWVVHQPDQDMPPELQALKDEGHSVMVVDLGEVDLVMGPKCWRIGPEHMKFLPLAIKEARAAMPKRTKKSK